MKYNFSKFYKNASHKSCCEDFVSYSPGNETLLLTDGCSTSPGDVVLGSRSFHRWFKNKPFTSFESMLLSFDAGLKENQYLNREDFFFTLLILRLEREVGKVETLFLGDGVFVLVDNENNYHIHSKEYDNNTPLYLGYYGDPYVPYLNHQNLFSANFPKGSPKIFQSYLKCKNNKNTISQPYFYFDHFKKFLFFSDGIDQIYDKEGNHIPRVEFLDFFLKNEDNVPYSHNLLERKASFYLKDKKLNDDFSFICLEKHDN